jgi:hypothetical protein
MLHHIKSSRRKYGFHLTYKHCNLLLQPLHHRLWDFLSTNLFVEVNEFSKHLPQIGFKIATEYYWHESLYENMVVVTVQSIEFTSADIDLSFYVLSHLSTSFLSVDFKQYWTFGLLSFPIAFGLASSEGRSQRIAKSFLIFTLFFVKLITSRHMLMMLSTIFCSWCIKSML